MLAPASASVTAAASRGSPNTTQGGVVGQYEQLGRRQRAQKTPVIIDHADQFPIGAALLSNLLADRLCRVAGFCQHGMCIRAICGDFVGRWLCNGHVVSD